MYLDPAVELVLRGAFIALFAAALAHKALRFDSFVPTVAAYGRGLPLGRGPIALVAALAVMLGEAGALVVCVVPVAHALRAGVISGILLLYAAAMAGNLLRGNTLLDCGCNWGSLRQTVGYPLVYRNLLLAALALVLALPSAPRSLGGLDLVTVLAGVALSALVYAAANRLFTEPFATGGTT